MNTTTVYQVTDNVHDTIYLTALERSVASGPLFGRLHFVYQDSTVFFTWPTARTQRYEHSLGTMHVAGEMFSSSLANAEIPVIEDAADYYSEALGELLSSSLVESLPNTPTINKDSVIDEAASFQRRLASDGFAAGFTSSLEGLSFLIPTHVPDGVRVALAWLAQAIRLAGMLHDVGHPPMSHVCEYALRNIYSDIADGSLSGAPAAEEVRCGIDAILGGKSPENTALHEQIGNQLSALALIRALHDLDPKGDLRGFACSACLASLAILNDWGPFAELHTLVSGTVDADRLDYVQRDSMAANLGSDALQYRRLCDSPRLVRSRTSGFAFAYPMDVVPTIEEFLTKRFMVYKAMIYHPNVVRSEELLKSVLLELARIYLSGAPVEAPQSLYLLNDDISGLWQPLSCDLDDEPQATLIYSQWNDYWLRTTLRNELISRIHDGRRDELLTCRLVELFYQRGRYVSVMDDIGDNARFRKALASCLLNEPEARHEGSQELEEALQRNAVPEHVRHGQPHAGASLADQLRRSIGAILTSHGYGFDDILVVGNRVKIGVGELNLYRKDGTLVPLDDVSPIRSVLERYSEGMPLFYGYVLFDDDSRQAGESFLHGDTFAQELAQDVSQFLCG